MPDSDPSKPIPIPPELQGLDPRELFALGLQPSPTSQAGTLWEPPTPEEVARLLPQYRIERLIGRGGMGAVYKGTQPGLDRPVAIKILFSQVAIDDQAIRRFRREARILAKLHHPGIVAVYDFDPTTDGHLYFVMEYVDGTDLRQRLNGPGLARGEALELIVQICEALSAAHQQGVIHRDIKPENVLITREGRVKLVDFGLARPCFEENVTRLTMTNMLLGTPDYMSPEQETGLGDHRADIFALGVMFYEMLTGKCPRGAFLPPSGKVAVDGRIDEVVLKALQEDPARRYQKVSEMQAALNLIRATPIKPPRVKNATPQVHRRSPFRLGAVGAAGALVLMSLLVLLIWNKNAAPESKQGAEISPAQSPPATAISVAQGASFPAGPMPEEQPKPLGPLTAAEEKKSAKVDNSVRFHGQPPYLPFAPIGAPYRIETTLHPDFLEIYVVNTQPGVINVQFAFSNIMDGHTEWATSGAKNCEFGSRILLAAVYKDETSPVTYDLSTRWTQGAVPTFWPMEVLKSFGKRSSYFLHEKRNNLIVPLVHD